MKCYTPGYGFIVPIGTTVVHRFQLLHCRPCTQMLLPPQSSSLLHWLRSRAPVCSHSEAAPPAPPPQSVHLLRAPALGQPHSGAKCGPFVWF